MTDHRCPDDEMIAAYFDGLLSEAEEARFLTEMNRCPECVQTLASVGIVLRDADSIPDSFQVPGHVTAQAVALYDRFVPRESLMTIAVRFINDALTPLADALQPTMTPAMAMRSAAPDLNRFEELRFHVSLGDVALEIDLEIDGPDEVALKVTPTSPPPSGLLLRLAADGETRAVSSLSTIGATVGALPPGGYELTLEQGTRSIGKMNLELHR